MADALRLLADGNCFAVHLNHGACGHPASSQADKHADRCSAVFREEIIRLIDTIQGHAILEMDDLSVTFDAAAMIDGDGSGSSHGDPDFQPDTSLHHMNGVALNADIDCYIAVPPSIIRGVRGIVLGCKALVTYQGKSVDAVVGDIGPRRKIGEISIATAKALGIPSSPLTGGVDSGVSYQLWPGVAAPGYQLKHS